ncbi:MAG: lytic transglycosylase domain-containing protein [Marinobacter sp.]
MKYARTFCSPLLAFFLAFASNATYGDTIKRIVHSDGSVEFSNVKSNSPLASDGAATVYRYQDKYGVVSYSGERPANTKFLVIRFHCFACDPASTVNWDTTPLFASRYNEQIATAAKEFDVDPALVRAVIHAESAFNPKALSPKGAQGLMQLMPATASELGVANAMIAEDNIRGGANYLAQMLARFRGDTKLATAAYNAGPGAVSRHNGIPPYAETEAYVKRVGILHRRYAAL